MANAKNPATGAAEVENPNVSKKLPVLILVNSAKIGGEYVKAKSQIDTDDTTLHAELLKTGAAKKYVVINSDEVVVEDGVELVGEE